MSNIYILEGPDCCGKTTLMGSEAFMGMPKYHQGPYDGDPLAQTLDMIHSRCNLSKEWASDRLHYGELVYGPVLRNQDKLKREGLRFVDRVLRTHDTVVVTCLPPLDVALTSFLESRYAQLPGIDQYEAIYNAYKCGVHAPMHGIPHIIYDYTTTTSSELLLKIEEVNSLRARERFHASGVGVGSFAKGNLLVVFDDMSVPTERTLRANFVLEFFKVDEYNVFWTTPENVYANMKSIVELEPKTIVCCDEAAIKAVRHGILPTFRGLGRQSPVLVTGRDVDTMVYEIPKHTPIREE